MIKIILGLVILVSVIAQDVIICSGFIRIPKSDKQDINVNQIEMKLLTSNNQFIDYIEITQNGFYSIEIEDDPSSLIDYIVFIQPKVKGFMANPSQINLKFQSKSFDEASSFCNKQLNFSIKRAPIEEQIAQQQQQEEERTIIQEDKVEIQQKQDEIDQNIEFVISQTIHQESSQTYDEKQDDEKEQVFLNEQDEENYYDLYVDEKQFDHFRLIGQVVFDEQFTQEEKNLYYIKSFKVLDNLEEQVQGRTLSFHNYFEVETNEAKTIKVQLVVEKTKEKGESTNKQLNFEQQISKIQLLNRQINVEPITFAIKKEISFKEQNKAGQVFAPLFIFGLVLAMFNYDKILKKK